MSEWPWNETITLYVGRVDLYNLPVFPQSESELLRNYLEKDHNFRHKNIEPKLRALVSDALGWFNGYPYSIAAWRPFTAMLNSTNVNAGQYLREMKYESYIWSSGFGTGVTDGTGCTGIGASSDFIHQRPKTVFSSALASYMYDWDFKNDLMRAMLASNGWILTCCALGFPLYPFHLMGMGETIGFCLRATQNNRGTYESEIGDTSWYKTDLCISSILGDPTLRMHIVCPINTLHSAITTDSTVMLAWKPADDEDIVGYYIYKLDTVSNKYNRILFSPVTHTWYEDTLPDAGNNYYMVRTLNLSHVASGSYYNLSQGIFDTIEYVDQIPVPVSDVSLSLFPDNTLPLKIYDPFQVNVTVTPENATNKLLQWSVENLEGQGKFDKNGMVIADKGGKITIIAEALDGSDAKGRIEVTIDSVPNDAGEITGESNVCRSNSKSLYTVPVIRGASSYIWSLPNGETDTILINEIEYNLNKDASSGNLRVKGHNIYVDGTESQLYITLYEVPPRPVITLREPV